MLPPRLIRRLLLAPLTIVIAIALVVLFPLLALIAALVGLVGHSRPGRMRGLRLLWFALLWLTAETLTLVTCLGLWIASGFGGRLRTEPYASRHYAVLRWFVALVYRAGTSAFGVRVEVAEPELTAEEQGLDAGRPAGRRWSPGLRPGADRRGLRSVEQGAAEMALQRGRERASELGNRNAVLQRDECDRRRPGPGGRRRVRRSRSARRASGSAPRDRAGEACSSARNRARAIASRSLRARRGPMPSEANRSAAPARRARRRARARGSPRPRPRRPPRGPARTTYMASPGSPSRNSHCPAASAPCRRERDLLAQRWARARRTAARAAGTRPPTPPAAASVRQHPTLIARRARGRCRRRSRRPRPGREDHPRRLAERRRLAAGPGARRAGSRARRRTGRPRRTSRRARTRAGGRSGVGVPMIATTTATPSAAPTWRATEFSPVAVAKLPPGAEATAAPLRFGNSVPAPIPSITIPGSHSPRKSGVTPDPLDEPQHRAAPDQPARDEHRPVPDALDQPAVGPATAAATNGPGVSARPASSTEYCHTPVRNRTLVSV